MFRYISKLGQKHLETEEMKKFLSVFAISGRIGCSNTINWSNKVFHYKLVKLVKQAAPFPNTKITTSGFTKHWVSNKLYIYEEVNEAGGKK